MSVPFTVTFNQTPGVIPVTGSPQTIYVTSSSPADATFSQVYPSGITTASAAGESVTVMVTGTGRFFGFYVGTITLAQSGGGGGGSSNLQQVTTGTGNNVTSNDIFFLKDVHIDGVLYYTPPTVIVYPPSAPLTVSNAGSALSWTVNYSAPEFTDAVNQTNTTALDNYRIVRHQTGLQLHSVNPATQTDQTFLPTGTSQNFTVYPEAPYLVTVEAKNVSNVNYGASNTFVFTTGILPRNPNYVFPGSLHVPAFYSQDFSNILTPTVLITDAELIRGTMTSVQCDHVNVPLNAEGNRGSLFTEYTLSAGGGTGTTYQSLTPGYPPGPSTYGSNTLTTVAVSDQYSTTGSTGYYAFAEVYVTTDLVPSPFKQSMVLTDSTSTASSHYYYDGTTGSPDCGSATLSVSLGYPTSVSVCGVPCFHQGQQITGSPTVSGAQNLGRYFQPQYPVTYSVSGGASGTAQGESLSIGTPLFATVGSSFARILTVSSTVFNTVSSTPGPSFTDSTRIFDDPSYQEVLRTSTMNPCNQGSPVPSQRVSSSSLTTFTSRSAFDNSATLVGTSDIQLAAGVYSTYGKSDAYLNYAAAGGPDYTGLTGPRFATFAWSFPTGYFVRTSINITIQGLPTPDAGSTSDPMTFNGRPLQVFYRYHDPAQTQLSQGGFGSVWIDGNNNTKPYLSYQNYWDETKTPYGFNSWTSLGSGNYSFTVSMPNSVLAPPGCFLYVMVGFDDQTMASQYGFSGVILNSV